VESLASFSEYLGQLERNTRDLHEQIMSIKRMPVKNALHRIPRLIHDLSISRGKKVALEITGETIELDKTVLEQITDPLVHLVRNALDHGIESPEIRISNGKPARGTIRIDASLDNGYAILRISDDGSGMIPGKLLARAIEKDIISKDEELSISQILDLVFLPGFSTVDDISNISGRGVGMDVVRQNIMDLGGTVDIWSKRGIGTTFTIRLPLAIAIADSQVANTSKQVHIMPPRPEKETLCPDNEDFTTSASERTLAQTIMLDSASVINDAESLYEKLGKASNQDMRIDASAVEKIDTAVMQLLYAFTLKADSLSRKISWINPSNEFKSSAALLGLSEKMKIFDIYHD
jgi:two-component system chemotaxis sensor kinase CheA